MIINKHYPKPKPATPCELGVINKNNVFEVGLTIFQFQFQLPCKHRPNFVPWDHYMVFKLLGCPALTIVRIEVTIQNQNLDIGREKLGKVATLLIAYSQFYHEVTPTRCPDLPLCKNFVARGIHEGEFVGWRQVLFNSLSA